MFGFDALALGILGCLLVLVFLVCAYWAHTRQGAGLVAVLSWRVRSQGQAQAAPAAETWTLRPEMRPIQKTRLLVVRLMPRESRT